VKCHRATAAAPNETPKPILANKLHVWFCPEIATGFREILDVDADARVEVATDFVAVWIWWLDFGRSIITLYSAGLLL
jgi:hypothetical protein